VKLGFLTACLPELSLPDIAAWASSAGYEALEVAVWPSTGSRDFEASHIDVARFGAGEAEQVGELFAKHGLQLSSLAYYENNLHPTRRGGPRSPRTSSARWTRPRCSAWRPWAPSSAATRACR
jgi:sugar phosphate isomerase/epimerase